jgi:hypothetical protein
MRFSLKRLFLISTLAALACAALIFASPWWGAVCFTASVVLILASFVLAYAATGATRAFWIGVAIFGCGYWLALDVPIAAEPFGRPWTIGTDNPLVTSRVLEWAYNQLLPMVRADEPKVDPVSGKQVGNWVSYPNGNDFGRVGHSLFAILTAFFGGWLGRFAYRRYGSRAAQE